MTAISETISATDGGDNCRRCNWSDSRYGGDLLAQRRMIHERTDPAFRNSYFVFQSTQTLDKRHDQGLAEAGELSLSLYENLGYHFPEGRWRLCYREATLAQETSCLVDNRRSLLDQKFAHAMCCLHVLLFNRLHGDEVHGRTGCGLDDSFSVVAIILVRFNERRNVVGTDEANLETCFLETSRPVMGRATRFHRDRAGTEGPHCFDQRRSGNLVAVYRPAAYIGAVELKDALGEVNAEKIDFHDVPPHGFPKARRPVSRGRSVGSISVAVVQSLGPGDGGGATRHPAVSGVRAAGHGHNAAARREHDPAVPPPA